MRSMSGSLGSCGVRDGCVGAWPWPGLAWEVGALPGMAPLGMRPLPVPWLWLSLLVPSPESPGVGP